MLTVVHFGVPNVEVTFTTIKSPAAKAVVVLAACVVPRIPQGIELVIIPAFVVVAIPPVTLKTSTVLVAACCSLHLID